MFFIFILLDEICLLVLKQDKDQMLSDDPFYLEVFPFGWYISQFKLGALSLGGLCQFIAVSQQVVHQSPLCLQSDGFVLLIFSIFNA